MKMEMFLTWTLLELDLLFWPILIARLIKHMKMKWENRERDFRTNIIEFERLGMW